MTSRTPENKDGQSRREFVTRAVGVGLAAAGGAALPGCSDNEGKAVDGVPADPAAVKGGPKTTPDKSVTYPDGYVGPVAAKKGPIVVKGEKVKLKVVVPKDVECGDWNTNAFSKWYEQQTGVQVEFQAVGIEGNPTETMTKVNAMIAAGDVPDVFMNIDFSNSQLMLYGARGLFLPLEKYIDDYGVEIKRVFENHPGTRDLITAPDGHIYSMPYVNDCYHCRAGTGRTWIYQPWLDKLGLDMPQTLDEFHEVLQAFKTEDPNGNGRADEVPFIAEKESPLDPFIMGSFLYNPGVPWVVLDGNERVDVPFDKPEWREGLRYLRTLFQDGLLAEQSFTQTAEQLRRLGDRKGPPTLGVVRAFYWGTFKTIDDDDPSADWRNYVAVPTLKGPKGGRTSAWDSYGATINGQFVVTNACKYPAVAMLWADGQYELEATMRAYSGDFQKGWRWAKPGEKGIDGKQALWTTLGTWPPENGKWWAQNGVNYRSNDYRLGEVVDPKRPTFEKPLYDDTKRAYYPHRPDKSRELPPLYMTEEQAALTGELAPTIENHVEGSLAKFVRGELDVDSDAAWKKYTDTLEQMGLEKYLEAHQAAYDSKYK